MSDNSIDVTRNEVGKLVITPIAELSNIQDQSIVLLLGVVVKVKILSTESNTLMGIAEFSDSTGSIEVVLFPEPYEKFGKLLEGEELIYINGTLDVSDASDFPIKVMVDEIFSSEND
jgi:DNA polymerase-3 subunit alpha